MSTNTLPATIVAAVEESRIRVYRLKSLLECVRASLSSGKSNGDEPWAIDGLIEMADQVYEALGEPTLVARAEELAEDEAQREAFTRGSPQ